MAANDVPESYLPIRAKSHSPKKKAQHQASDMVLKEFAKSLAFEDNEASVSNKVQISSSDSEEDYVSESNGTGSQNLVECENAKVSSDVDVDDIVSPEVSTEDPSILFYYHYHIKT